MPPSSGDHSPLAITALPGKAGLRLAGEVDITNHAQVRSALAALLANCPATIHLDTAGLNFIDVAGSREIITALRSRPGLRIILHSPPACLLRIITLLWPEANIKITGPVTSTTTFAPEPKRNGKPRQTARTCVAYARNGARRSRERRWR